MGCMCRTNDRLAQRQLAAIKLADADDAVASDDDERFLALGNEAIVRINIETLKHDPSRPKTESPAAHVAHSASLESNASSVVKPLAIAGDADTVSPLAPRSSEVSDAPLAANGMDVHPATRDGDGDEMVTDTLEVDVAGAD